MARFRPAVFVYAALVSPLLAAEPVDRTLAVQSALAQAKDHLLANRSAAAVELLEKHLPHANGDRAYLDLLRSAYLAELKRGSDDPRRAADLRAKLALLGEPVAQPEPAVVPPPVVSPPVVAKAEPTPPAPRPENGADTLRQAANLFNEAKAELSTRPTAEPLKFRLAAAKFAAAFLGRVEMSPDQMAAWAYCRLRVAADQLNRPGSDPAAVVAEVEEALTLAPTNAGLQKVGRDLIAAARQRAGSAPTPARSASAVEGWEVIETASFRVRHQGRRDLAESLARVAEAKRNEIFIRWSGPPGGGWEPKCELVLHPTGESLAKEAQQPVGSTGRALVKLDGGRAVERRIDLRADDPAVGDDTLPRELTYVVLADLFPAAAPPRWAEAGMAVLAASPAEQDRYRRTLSRCYSKGELFPVETLLELKAPPADRVTAFSVASVSLVEFLVKWKGEKAFTTFLRDAQRYGQPQALKRQYGVGDARQLEEVWMRSELSTTRGQAP